jgi:hypothetical protein
MMNTPALTSQSCAALVLLKVIFVPKKFNYSFTTLACGDSDEANAAI